MANTRYSYSVDLTNPTTSHSLAVLMVAPGSLVLDIGAADGSVARPLVERGCRVWAIEADPEAAAKARSVCERVIVGDVEHLDLVEAVEGTRFDVVLLLDVLEHLRDPLAALERARELLAPTGRVIVSIPNVAHGAVRVSLMSGSFNYTETGLLDSSHLRFFDRRSAERLVRSAGLRIIERLRVTRGLTETEISIDPAAVAPDILKALEADEDATTYQFVLAAVPATGEYIPDTMTLAERLQRRTVELESEYRRLEAYARSLEPLASRASSLEQRELETAVAQKDLELRHAMADLAVKEAFIAALRQELSTLRTIADSAGVRIVNNVTGRLSRHPRVFGWVRRIARRVAGTSTH